MTFALPVPRWFASLAGVQEVYNERGRERATDGENVRCRYEVVMFNGSPSFSYGDNCCLNVHTIFEAKLKYYHISAINGVGKAG